MGAEYLSELSAQYSRGHSHEAPQGSEVETCEATVIAACIAEVVGMLNRYASTEARQAALVDLGVLRPLTCLLSGATDSLVLRCALETLVHFTLRVSVAVLRELARLSLRGGVSLQELAGIDLLPQVLTLLTCREDTYEELAAQLLEQLFESAELRSQFRQLCGVPTLLDSLRVASAPKNSCGSSDSATGRQGRQVRLLRCCKRLAKDHMELGAPMAVQELRE